MRLLGPKVRKGQVWAKKTDANHKVLIVQAGDAVRGKRIDKPHIQHHFKIKSLWLFYDLIGTENNHE